MAAGPPETILASPGALPQLAWRAEVLVSQLDRSPWPWTVATTNPVVDLEPLGAQPDPPSGAASEGQGGDGEGWRLCFAVGAGPRLEQRLG